MDISISVRQLLVEKFKSGLKQKDICQHLNLKKSAVSKLLKQYKTTGSVLPQRKGRCGKKQLLSEREISLLRRESIKNPQATAREIQAAVGGQLSSLSVRSIRRYLRRCGRFSYRPRYSQSLNRSQRSVRYRWAKEKAQWTTDDWKKVVFSDETLIEMDCGTKEVYVRRSRDEIVKAVHTKHRRAFAKRLLVWGCISSSGPGPIEVIKGTLDSAKYLQILQKHIIPFAHEIEWYQQDNAPPHKTKEVMKTLFDANIEVLQWPPYSPDLNCIENIWSILKRKVAKVSCSTLDELANIIKSVWEHDDEISSACKPLVNSMTRRMSAVIRSRGGPIKY